MLGMPPPGYNTSPINRQTLGYLSVPGYQGMSAQGYNPTASSFAVPSSAHYPSSLPAMAGSPGGALPPGVTPQMAAKALMPPRPNPMAKRPA